MRVLLEHTDIASRGFYVARGETVDLPDDEAAKLIARGVASKVETTMIEHGAPVKRGRGRPRKHPEEYRNA